MIIIPVVFQYGWLVAVLNPESSMEKQMNWDITLLRTPYTFMIRLKKTAGQIYEYACHEGNYAMSGILAGARRDEARAAAKKPRATPGGK